MPRVRAAAHGPLGESAAIGRGDLLRSGTVTTRIYLDNAATSFPKPPGVYEAMLDYGTRVGASPGRGHYAESREGARLIRQ